MLTVLVIEISAKEAAGVILQNGIDANHILAIRLLPSQMVVIVIVGQGLELAVGAFGTLECLLVAKSHIPFPFAHGLIPRLPRCLAEPPTCKRILPTTKQTAE